MSALLDLAARVEAAAEPDRELDFEIARAVLNRCVGAAKFTASLDAAMTLVPGGDDGRWQAGQFNLDARKCSAQVAVQGEIPPYGMGVKVRASGHAATPALALCAAALKARASSPKEPK